MHMNDNSAGLINDEVFGELSYSLFWHRDMNIQFAGKDCVVALNVDGDEDGGFDESQYIAYQSLMKNWVHFQHRFLTAILDYYVKRRYELGYAAQINKAYPLIETVDEIAKHIELVGIAVPYGDIFDGRDIGLMFDCTWDIENGLGLRLINEEVFRIGYQDVAI